MPVSLRTLAAIAFVIAPLAFSSAVSAAAPAVVTVTLDNKSITTDLPNNLGMAMPGADMSKAVMSITASPTTVPAGEVTFVATNKSTDFTHEMILIKVTDPHKQLPYVGGDSKVDEDAAGHLGEVSELDPGKSGTLSMKLDPGTYMLLCNVPGHYMAGMWTAITVK
jgi:uncharacterized cupredoxin-like copper-binding protein